LKTLHCEQQPLPAAPQLRERDLRLESLKLLAGRLAHDFNNSIAPLLGYLALIKEETNPDSIVLQYALAMETSARKTEAILEDVLQATRPMRRFHPEWVDVAALITQEVKIWRGVPGTPRCVIQLDLAECKSYLDRWQWQQVVRQLLRNAGRALAPDGEIRVRLAPRTFSAQEAVEFGLSVLDLFELEFTDNGSGMDEETAGRAFEPFFSTLPKNQAAGLGLPLVHSVVRCHGGQVILNSRSGRGTTVTVWLPAGDQAVTDQLFTPIETAGVRGKILVVDDDPTIVEVTREFLQQAHFEVLVALSGREGINLFRQHASQISLVISDLTMPEMNGIEMIKELRSMAPLTPVILITGADETTRSQAWQELAGARGRLLRKPFLMKELMQAIEEQVR
jgi:two-component system cell cycle sensor histidine kinase/response regulator CckA